MWWGPGRARIGARLHHPGGSTVGFRRAGSRRPVRGDVHVTLAVVVVAAASVVAAAVGRRCRPFPSAAIAGRWRVMGTGGRIGRGGWRPPVVARAAAAAAAACVAAVVAVMARIFFILGLVVGW